MSADDVRQLLRAEIRRAGTQLAFAVEHDVDRTCLSGILAGAREPSPQVLKALKLRRRYVYEKDE